MKRYVGAVTLMRTQLFLIVIAIGLYGLVGAAPATAHHAFAAAFDANKPITVRGTIAKVEWINPHSWIYIDAKTTGGNIEVWMIELGGANSLVARGVTRDSIKIGTEVVVNGYQSKNGGLRASGRDLTLPNGQVLYLGSSGSGAPYEGASSVPDDRRVVRSQVPGAWWTNAAIAQRLGLTDEQKIRIERTFENHRQTIISSTGLLEKEEAQLARLLDTEPMDRNAVLVQIDRVIQARSETERVNAAMTLEIREHLSRAQWQQLLRTNAPPVPPQGRGRGQ